AIIGAPQADVQTYTLGNSTSYYPRGAAYIFTGSGSNWVQVAKITGRRFWSYDILFGTNVAINSAGNTAVITMSQDLSTLKNEIYIFTGSGSNWTNVKNLKTNVTDENLGYSMSINSGGNVLLLGAPGKAIISPANGGGYIYTNNGSDWVQTAALTQYDNAATVGYSTALNAEGNIAAVGAPTYRGDIPARPDLNKGAVYIYTKNGGGWEGFQPAITGEISNMFGNHISLNAAGNILAVGRVNANTQNKNTLSVFSGSRDNWTKIFTFNPSIGTPTNTDVSVGGVALNSIGNVLFAKVYASGLFAFYEKLNQTITFNPLDIKNFGDPLFYLSGGSDSNLPLTYTSSNTNVAIITGRSGVLITGAGTSIITASNTGNEYYYPTTSATQLLTVNKANQTITFSSLPTKTYGDAPFSLSATAS
ncbi:hypothetical protein EBU71_20730, partial [bacterium]|nr:hypothetical protein [Candidatus Elulimicrobium humile]